MTREKTTRLLSGALGLFLTSAAPSFAGNDITASFVVDGQTRTAIVHLPTNYTNPSLVMVFHGDGGTSAGMERATQFDTVSDQHGFIVIYPQGLNGNWTTTAPSADQDFADTLVAKAEHAYGIDPQKVYVVGFSKGAGMARLMACSATIPIAGLASVSNDMNNGAASACASPQQMPVVVMHGTCDPVSPFENGSSALSPTAPVWSAVRTAAFWIAADAVHGAAPWNPLPAQPVGSTLPANHQPTGCPFGADNPMAVPITYPDSTISYPPAATGTTVFADTVEDNQGSKVTTQDIRQVWGSPGNRNHVTLYEIGYGGHEWPGGHRPGSPYGYASLGINAAAIIWQNLTN